MTRAEALEYFGSGREIARILDIHETAISQWRDAVPLTRQAQLEIISHGKLRAELPPKAQNYKRGPKKK